MSSIAKPNVSRETAKWATEVDADRTSLAKRLFVVEQSLANLSRQQSGVANALGTTNFSLTPPAVFQASDNGGNLVNSLTSNPVQYTNVRVPIPEGYNMARISMTGSVAGINTGTGMTIQLCCNPFYNLDPAGDVAFNEFFGAPGICPTPLNGSGTAVSAVGEDIDVTTYGATDILVGIISYIEAGASPVSISGNCRVSGSIAFYKS